MNRLAILLAAWSATITAAELSITTQTMPNAVVGKSYTFQFQGIIGAPPFEWSISPGWAPFRTSDDCD
jgi:hypothetical protein